MNRPEWMQGREAKKWSSKHSTSCKRWLGKSLLQATLVPWKNKGKSHITMKSKVFLLQSRI